MSGKKMNILVLLTFIAMVVVNGLANILPINGVTTAEVSDSYPNLFTPVGFTFSIWGVIYLLLGIYSVYQLVLSHKNKRDKISKLTKQIAPYFIISSLANALWIVCWHYNQLGLSIVCMLIILMSLIVINRMTSSASPKGKIWFLTRLPFSVYFGWIMVATIANITVFLVSLGWEGLVFADYIWTVIMLVAGAVIGITAMLFNKDWVYGIVFSWAYFGILFKHMSPEGFKGDYGTIITTLVLSIIALLSISMVSLVKSAKAKRVVP